MKDKRKTNQQLANSLVMVLQFGINVLVPILLCMFIRKLITDKTGESAFTIIGILLGIVAAFNGAFLPAIHFFHQLAQRL